MQTYHRWESEARMRVAGEHQPCRSCAFTPTPFGAKHPAWRQGFPAEECRARRSTIRRYGVMAKTTEQIVTELADREAIRELPQRYCDCVWRGDVDGLVGLFADDGVFTIINNGKEITNKGAAALQKTYK